MKQTRADGLLIPLPGPGRPGARMARPTEPPRPRPLPPRPGKPLPALQGSPLLPVLGQPPAAPPERADAARNRTRILEAARHLVRRRPIGEIGMDEVADAAGVGKGTLYRRFADRAALCRALLDDQERVLQQRVLRGFELPAGAPAWRRLEALLDALLDFVLDNAALLTEVEAWEHGDTARFAAPPYAWRRQEIRRLVEEARREQGHGAGDAGVAADLALATLDPVLMQWHAGQGATRDTLRAVLHRAWVQPLR